MDAVEEIGVVGGALRCKPVRRTLSIGALGINAQGDWAAAVETGPERAAAWAREDEDLDPLRDMGGYPPMDQTQATP
ncbi:MAG TPA: hypothetical protein VNT03_19135 [Baekduia sp.]|nr:hypothetical protein [Baekduia sp.]